MSRALDNWLEAYLAYTAESESPEEYHLWTAISSIAGVLRRKCFFDMGYFLVYPNLYIVLVGPPGRCKKSTAMRIGRQQLGKVEGMHFTVDSTTRERLIQDLSQAFNDSESAMTAHSTEFASLLTSSGMDMVVFLTDIFDSPNEWVHKTKGGGTNKIKFPFLNLLGATTPDWIATAMPLDTIGIGLTSRVIFVFQDTPRVRHWKPTLTQAQKDLGELLGQDLARIAQINGEYKFSPEAEEVYDEWYKARVEEPNWTGDPRLSGYFERKPIHLIKTAMIISAAMQDECVIELKHLQYAMRVLTKIEERMPQVFANVGKNPLNNDIELVYNAVASVEDGLPIGVLLDKFKYTVRKEELLEVIDTLVTIGKIAPRGTNFVAVRDHGTERASS